jgi:hypothetical protein
LRQGSTVIKDNEIEEAIIQEYNPLLDDIEAEMRKHLETTE